MPKALSTAALAGVACLATVAAGTISPAPSLAAHDSAAKSGRPSVTRFGFNSTVYGTKVVVDGTEVRSLKDALINRGCTRRAGLSSVAHSVLSTSVLPQDVQDIVSLSLSTSNTDTYHNAAKGRYGVRGTSTLGDITLGGVTVAGIDIPGVRLEGLKSTADAFFDAKADGGKGKYGYRDSFTYQGLSLDLDQDGPISTSLQKLLGLLGIDPDAIPDVVNVPVKTLVDLLTDVLGNGPLVIPGLGSISLGHSTGSANETSARANAYALKITLANEQLGLTPTTLELGMANSVVSSPVQAGVFRSRMSALEADIGSLVRLGGIDQRTLPCEGTDGKAVVHRVATAGIPRILSLAGIEYRYKGLQKGKAAKGFVQTTIGDVDLLQAGVELKGLVSRVDVSSKHPNQRVTSKATTTIGHLLIGGKEVSIPAVGRALHFTDSTGQEGVLQRQVLDKNSNGFYGKHLTGIRITLPGTDTTLDLGVANGEVFFR